MIINNLGARYIFYDTLNKNTELDTIYILTKTN